LIWVKGLGFLMSGGVGAGTFGDVLICPSGTEAESCLTSIAHHSSCGGVGAMLCCPDPGHVPWGRCNEPTTCRGARCFNLPLGQPHPTIQGMFDTITAELATATGKLAHLRRFL
jgi:hypothetical protein